MHARQHAHWIRQHLAQLSRAAANHASADACLPLIHSGGTSALLILGEMLGSAVDMSDVTQILSSLLTFIIFADSVRQFVRHTYRPLAEFGGVTTNQSLRNLSTCICKHPGLKIIYSASYVVSLDQGSPGLDYTSL